MKVHVLVEGPSERAFIEPWARRAFKDHSVVAHPHQGKGTLPADVHADPDRRRRGLLDLLPATLRSYAIDAGPDVALLVLVDADREDCVELKRRLVAMKLAVAPKLRVVFRIAVEETEAFYLGDLRALAKAFPDANLDLARDYEPDSIVGTAEFFGRVVGDGGLNKVAWAEAMGPRVTTRPGASRSPSFRVFHAGFVKVLAGVRVPKKERPRKHWRARSNEWRRR